MKHSKVNWKLARCNDVPPSIFTPNTYSEANTAKAKSICALCIIKNDCKEYSLNVTKSYFLDSGVWGGTTPKERQEIRNQRKAESKHT